MATLEDTDKYTACASVLCFSVCDGLLYFLLGKEHAHNPNTKAGAWTDFGGRAVRADSDGAATALREFKEETMGVVPLLHGQSLADGAHVCSLAISMSASTQHVCYLKEVTWGADIPFRFLQLRQALLGLRRTSMQLRRLFYSETPGAHGAARLHLCDAMVHCAVDAPWRAQKVHFGRDADVAVTFIHNGTGATCTLPVNVPGVCVADWQLYSQYLALLHNLRAQFNGLPQEWQCHPALRVCRWRGQVTHVTVNRHFLELQCLRWWSLPDLHQLVQSNGQQGRNFLRRCFIPTLRAVLNYLAKHHSTHNLTFAP